MTAEIRLAIPPGHGQLRMWGQQGDHWYALIEWHMQCNDHRVVGTGYRSTILCTAWVAAEHVGKIDGQDYQAVPRIRLTPDAQRWPTRLRLGADTAPSDYYFGLLDGSPVAPPPGVTWMTGMGSRYG